MARTSTTPIHKSFAENSFLFAKWSEFLITFFAKSAKWWKRFLAQAL
jgi:hypothetical protein